MGWCGLVWAGVGLVSAWRQSPLQRCAQVCVFWWQPLNVVKPASPAGGCLHWRSGVSSDAFFLSVVARATHLAALDKVVGVGGNLEGIECVAETHLSWGPNVGEP